jgi:hypothetical protein
MTIGSIKEKFEKVDKYYTHNVRRLLPMLQLGFDSLCEHYLHVTFNVVLNYDHHDQNYSWRLSHCRLGRNLCSL